MISWPLSGSLAEAGGGALYCSPAKLLLSSSSISSLQSNDVCVAVTSSSRRRVPRRWDCNPELLSTLDKGVELLESVTDVLRSRP
jgi:hypothetical protein